MVNSHDKNLLSQAETRRKDAFMPLTKEQAREETLKWLKENFEVQEIQPGERWAAGSCPITYSISDYIRKTWDRPVASIETWRHGIRVYTHIGRNEYKTIDIPYEVQEFILYFDTGQYPDLELKVVR